MHFLHFLHFLSVPHSSKSDWRDTIETESGWGHSLIKYYASTGNLVLPISFLSSFWFIFGPFGLIQIIVGQLLSIVDLNKIRSIRPICGSIKNLLWHSGSLGTLCLSRFGLPNNRTPWVKNCVNCAICAMSFFCSENFKNFENSQPQGHDYFSIFSLFSCHFFA